jgi:F1F0 ATPase subunit 2
MMIDAVSVVVGLLAGVVLGGIFFGGLWLTTRRMNSSRSVMALVVGSFVARSLTCLVGLFVVARFTGLTGILSSLPGFLAMQILFLRLSAKRTTTRCPK